MSAVLKREGDITYYAGHPRMRAIEAEKKAREDEIADLLDRFERLSRKNGPLTPLEEKWYDAIAARLGELS